MKRAIVAVGCALGLVACLDLPPPANSPVEQVCCEVEPAQGQNVGALGGCWVEPTPREVDCDAELGRLSCQGAEVPPLTVECGAPNQAAAGCEAEPVDGVSCWPAGG